MDNPAPLHPEAANSLALALIASSNAPLLLLDGESNVISASDSFGRAFQLDTANISDRALATLGCGELAVPQLDALLKATASGTAQAAPYEMDLNRPGRGRRQLVLNVQKLSYGGGEEVRVLLSVADVTDARIAEKIKDDLARDQGVLLQELQHRVANSLQIIASVLMQSARRVQSDETRLHLHDAHHRVMSVAAVQKQLAASSIEDVELRAYFTDLCRSIGASMIRDHNQLSLDVSADEAVTGADVSVSLGLIVTELVINALKHAFPDHASGKIKVGYHAEGSSWTLSVSDNGVGMPARSDDTRSGLGTTIVDALAKKLDAKVEVTDAEPGTTVSVVHAL
ncbi:sensor histidine kinase [Sphingomonas nostoxanthinifaciens]|uniref:sensor histidine kinase n=1 Tax=Sphingomonas nostoxanthinifaciens TaxID=2872652 RepID=UPI001CC1EB95|nr:sensor histidine kinase [Sphingomonas nostoxanthinifaciens]UAK23850.1 sensor histidine kinase [Sphingomonas nostoxanthinifaciens]